MVYHGDVMGIQSYKEKGRLARHNHVSSARPTLKPTIILFTLPAYL